MTEFQKLQKKHPGVDWRKAYDPIPDDEWEKWENFEIPEFLKKKLYR